MTREFQNELLWISSNDVYVYFENKDDGNVCACVWLQYGIISVSIKYAYLSFWSEHRDYTYT